MRKILLGATVLAAAGAALVVGPAQAVYNGANCTGGGAYGAGPGPVYVGATALGTGDQGMETADPLSAAAGVCFDNPVTGTGFDGGVLEVGGGVNLAGENRLCGGVYPGGPGTADTEYPSPVGVYAVADGHSGNVDQTLGYAGVSNYESSTDAEDTETTPGTLSESTCEPNDGSRTNSGGSVGVTAAGVYAPVPFVVCGNDSGPTWNDTGRDGCFVDTT